MTALPVPSQRPDDEPDTLAAVLDDVHAMLGRFVAFPSDAAGVAVTLWAAHTHAVDAFDSTPRLALLSPEPGSGKTRTLEVLELVTPAPMAALSASPAAIFRTIDAERPTLLMDEVDALFGRRGNGDDGAEDLRALLNAGHRRGATIPRCVGPTHQVRRFPVYAAVALAGLGDLPDTLMSRSVIVRIRKRAPGEHVEPFRRRVHAPAGEALRDRLAVVVGRAAEDLADAWPDMPAGVVDRPADVWEPLLAVADAAGGDWPDRARAACVELCRVAASREASLGVKLLTDLREVFGDELALPTETVLSRVCALDESPWQELRGRPLDARGLARRLRQYEVRPTKVKVNGESLKGYRRDDLWDAWSRYLAPTPTDGEPGEPGEPRRSDALSEVPLPHPDGEPAPPAVPRVPHGRRGGEPRRPPLTSTVPEVPQVPHSQPRESPDAGSTAAVAPSPSPSVITTALAPAAREAAFAARLAERRRREQRLDLDGGDDR